MSKNPNSPVKSAAAPRSRRSGLRLTYVIGSLDRALRRRMSDVLAPLGLTLAQFTALSVLETRGQASNAQLAERSFITPQSANEVMNAMASRGWVSREPDPMHGRIVLLQLTEQGRAVLRKGEQAVLAIERQMTEGVDADAAAALQEQLETFVRNLRG
ncbi:MarR family transcriptional regulator (plasmid) [Paraburkholderia sp. PREW-6R]|uniref:MarR family winged helix-turn-helix transcriptional regulator n=1 Tax=Paraburkholderia sp. PREW-6R TaxID=3141544 RepID=UPI0031F49CC7